MYIVLGKGGMLGTDVCNLLKKENIEFMAYDYPEIDVTKKETLEKVIVDGVDVVINCTAHTAVDLAESEEDKAYAINAQGALNIAELCKKVDAKLVHISTDFVFSGDKEGCYYETDMPDPISAYGRTKYEGEKFIEKTMDKYFIVRTAYLFGKNGKNFIETMLSLKDRDELKVINDQKGSPTSTLDLAQAIVNLSKTEEYGIYHATSEGEATWYEFAKYVFDQLNLDVNIKPCTTSEYPTPAKRPANSVLENKNLKDKKIFNFPHWKEAVDEYLKDLK